MLFNTKREESQIYNEVNFVLIKHSNSNPHIVLSKSAGLIKPQILIKLQWGISFPKWEIIVNNVSGNSVWAAHVGKDKFPLYVLRHLRLTIHTSLHLPEYHTFSISRGMCRSHRHCPRWCTRESVHAVIIIDYYTFVSLIVNFRNYTPREMFTNNNRTILGSWCLFQISTFHSTFHSEPPIVTRTSTTQPPSASLSSPLCCGSSLFCRVPWT